MSIFTEFIILLSLTHTHMYMDIDIDINASKKNWIKNFQHYYIKVRLKPKILTLGYHDSEFHIFDTNKRKCGKETIN